MEKKLAEKRKRQNQQMVVLSILVAVGVLGMILWSIISRLGFLNDGRKAFQVGEETYTVAEVEYYYDTAYRALLESMQGYGQLLGLDTTKDLAEQECPLTDVEMSWRDYLVLQAKERLAEISAVCQEAVAQGYQADDAVLMQVEQGVEYHRADSGIKEEELRRLLTQEMIAQAYEADWAAGCSFDEEELYAHYQEHLYEYSTYSYLYAYVGQQHEAADVILETEGEEEFRRVSKEVLGVDCYEIMDVSGADLGDRTTEDLVWIADESRKKGDTYLGKSGEDWYVLCYLGKDDQGFAEEDGDGHWRGVAMAGMKEERVQKWKEELMGRYEQREYRGIEMVGR